MTALAFNVALNLVLVPQYGIVAAAVVTVASELAHPRRARSASCDATSASSRARHPAARAGRRRRMAALLAARCRDAPAPLLVVALGAAVYAALVCAAMSPRSRRARRGAPRERRAALATVRLPRGPRDTRTWYRDADPMQNVDASLVDFVAGARRPPRCSTSGCGLGGYSKALGDRGFDVRASTSSRSTSTGRAALGRPTRTSTTARALPLDDDAVDTVVLLEVLEHLEDPAALLREARRVARRNVLVTTPNCTQSFGHVPVEFCHMLDTDHRQFFTLDSMRALLDEVFGSTVEQAAPSTATSPGSSCPGRCARSTGALSRAGRIRPAPLLEAPGRGVGGRVTRVLVRRHGAGRRRHGGARDPLAGAGDGARRPLRRHARGAAARASSTTSASTWCDATHEDFNVLARRPAHA